MTKFRYAMFVVTVFTVLALSAMNTVPALADDGVPPATETPQDGTTEEVPSVEETASEDSTIADVLASVPEGTDVVVLNDNGETVPLATQEAEDALHKDDPMWCPAGVTPGGAGCTASTASFAQMLINLTGQYGSQGPSKAGVIWVEAGYDSSVNDPVVPGFTLNGSGLSSMSEYALTINGGWIGNGKTLNPGDLSEFNTPIVITNWLGAVTLNNLLITNVPSANYAFEIGSSSSIVLNNVHIEGNSVTNGGAVISVNYGVAINDSSFNQNTGLYGLRILGGATSPIILNNVTAYQNSGYGAYLTNFNTPKAGIVIRNSNFNNNGMDGVYAETFGVISLGNVNAMANGHSGANLNNCNFNTATFFCNYSSASGVTIGGSNNFSNNGWDGLRVFSGGAITVNNLTANNNGTDPSRPGVSFPNPQDYNAYGKGVFLHNYGALKPQSIKLTGTNTFNGNASTGLFAFSYGAITANNLTASENECDIAKDTDIQFCAGAYLDGTGINLTGHSVFEDNARDGLIAYSYNAAINLIDLYVQGNDENGVVTESYGPKASNINILGTNIFSDNTGAGLLVFSNGIIITNNVTALSNNGDGVYLNNCDSAGNACMSSPRPVTMNGSNNINFNLGDGLYIESGGAIKVNNLTASNNAGWGAILDNNWTNAVGTVAITGFANTSNNGKRGLSIYSQGAVTTSNLTANSNGPASALAAEKFYDGVYINNATDPTKQMSVTLLGLNQFNDNWNTGLQITSYGIVLLNNITANNNGEPYDATNNPDPEGYGMTVDNSSSIVAKAVTLNGINTFNGNLNDGLYIYSKGAITVSKVTASFNIGKGAILHNQSGVFTAPVTILGYGTFNRNQYIGLVIYSNGAVITNMLTANFNTGGMGAYIDNYYDLLPASFVSVTMNGVNIFNGNSNQGLVVYSDGVITLNNVTANDNGGDGAYLDNVTHPGVLKNIILNGSNTFVNNAGSGLEFVSSGAVTVTRVISNLNLNDGITGTAVGSITLICGSLILNTESGYDLASSGLITLKGISTFGNTLANSYTGTPLITYTCPLP